MFSIEKIEIKKLESSDLPKFKDLIHLFEDVFDMRDFSIPDSKHLQHLLNRKDFFVIVALWNGKVIGGLTAYILEQYYSTKPLAYIYDLAVSRSFQREGIGQQLIGSSQIIFRENGIEEAFVQAEKVDDHAIDFYRKTSPSNEEAVVYFNYILKE